MRHLASAGKAVSRSSDVGIGHLVADVAARRTAAQMRTTDKAYMRASFRRKYFMAAAPARSTELQD